MKKLTYSRMAAARLRANKRGYLSLAIGIFLSIFLISCTVLGIYSVYLASLQTRIDKLGYVDMVVLDNDSVGDAELRALEQYDRIGHAYLTAEVTDMNTYIGWYDREALALLNIAPTAGRMPASAGEIAIEASVLDVLDVNWALGDTVTLALTAIDGTAETRTYTLVGFLPERVANLDYEEASGFLKAFPAIVVSTEEEAFSVGRTATHWVLQAKDGVSLRDILSTMNKLRLQEYFHCYAVDNSGELTDWAYNNALTNLIGGNSELISLLTMACMLILALLLSCCVGISGAMEGLLAKRREEIGVLRALGATRRQICRMFGRENLILALILAPASIAISCGAVCVLSLLFPKEVKFGFSIWLLAPVAVLSIGMILIAGYLPLVRASKLMPMSVIRDTAVLRHGKRIKSKKHFSAPKLISSRQVRFQSSRQIGAALLVGLMLLCSGLLVGVLTEYRNQSTSERAAFLVQYHGNSYRENQISGYYFGSMNQTSIAQMRRLDHVKRVEIDRKMELSVILPEVPSYAALFALDHELGMFTEEMLADSDNLLDPEIAKMLWEEQRQEYLELLKTYQIDGESFPMELVTIELNEKTLQSLNSELVSGKIDVDAINAGREVLIVAPEVWGYQQDYSSYHYWHSEKAAKNDIDGRNAELWAWNDAFAAGQTLPLMQLYQTEEYGEVYRNDESVTVGAVLSWVDSDIAMLYEHCCILTTEEGLRNMNLRAEGIRQISIYLDGEISSEEEETLQQQIEAIARRTSDYSVVNYMEIFRQSAQEDQQQVLFLLSIATVFFVVSVSMIVSSVTRRLQSEGRTIGMLRAVGANESDILGCYSGQMRASILGGTGIALAIMLGFMGLYFLDAISYTHNLGVILNRTKIYVYICIAIIPVAALCWAICRVLLRKRIREIVSRSIIENIKEL